MNVGSSLALDIAAGLIKIEGRANYTSAESDNSSLASLAVNYHHAAFTVALNPDTVANMISGIARAKLDSDLAATHVCSSIVVGGEATAHLLINER